MKKIYSALAGVLLTGCVSDPVLTGMPQDWQGKNVADLKAAWGDPTRVIAESNGTEVWEYRKSGQFVAPGEENTAFRMGGGGGSGMFGASGGIKTIKQGERQSAYENVARFSVKNGKIKKWYAERFVDGQRVWSDH
jgi:hypothetical protein